MKVEIKIDESATEARIIVVTNKMTEEILALADRLSFDSGQCIAGFRGNEVFLLEQGDLIRIYAADGKVFAVTAKGEYLLRKRLYELENSLDWTRFVRISHSEIVNLKKVKGFDLSMIGTIRVTMENGDVTYVSRRYVSKIKQVIGI